MLMSHDLNLLAAIAALFSSALLLLKHKRRNSRGILVREALAGKRAMFWDMWFSGLLAGLCLLNLWIFLKGR